MIQYNIPEFKARLKKPDNNNKWFTRTKYGGKSICIAGKPEQWKGSSLSNCVGYA